MKKKIFILIVLILSITSSMNAIVIRSYGGGSSDPMAFYLGATYGANIEKVGFNFGFNIEILSDLNLSLDTTYWSGDSSTILLGLNAQYSIINKPEWSVYLLSGLSYFLADSDDGIGINLGGGFEFKVSKLILYIEPKYSISGIDQFTISSGLRIPL